MNGNKILNSQQRMTTMTIVLVTSRANASLVHLPGLSTTLTRILRLRSKSTAIVLKRRVKHVTQLL